VRGGGDHIGVLKGRGDDAGSDEARDVRHVGEKVGPDLRVSGGRVGSRRAMCGLVHIALTLSAIARMRG